MRENSAIFVCISYILASYMHLFGNMQKPEEFWQQNIAKKWVKPLFGELI